MKKLHFLIISLIALILVLVWFRNGDILGGAEAELPFYKLDAFVYTTSWSWNNGYLGYATGLTTASFPTWWILSQLQTIGIPGFILQAALFWILFVSAGTGIYLLTKILFPNMPAKFLILAVFFYWFNPVSFISIWNRFLINFMFFWSLFPLALFVFIKGLKTYNYRWAISTIIITLLFSYAFSSIVFTLLLWFCLLYIILFFLIFYPGRRSFYLKYFFLSLGLFPFFHFWWISQYLSFIFSSSFSITISNFFTTEDNLATLAALSDQLGKLIYTLRFLPGINFDTTYGQTLLNSSSPFSILQYLFSAVILWTIYKYRKNREVILVSLLYFISLFLIKGQNSPFGEIFQFVFVKIVAFQAFRDPFEKFSYLLILSSTLIFIFGISRLNLEIKNILVKRLLYPLSLFFIIAIWGWPFYTGYVFSWVSDHKNKKLISYEVRVPDYYKDANNWLNDQEGEFRFISLPLGQEGMTYTWEKPYSGVEVSRNLFDKPNISFNTTIPFYYDLVANLSKYQLNENIFKYIPLLNSKYIVLRLDLDYKARQVADPSTVKKKLEKWVQEKLLSKRLDKGNIAIYEVDNKFTMPKIFITPNLITSNVTNFIDLTNSYNDFDSRNTTILNNENSQNLLIFPAKTFLPEAMIIKKDYKDEDLLAKLFYTQHLPTETFYPLIRLKEELKAPSSLDYLGSILYRTGILGKRAVEIYKLYLAKSNSDIVSQAERDYANTLLKLMPDLTPILHGNNQASQVVRDSLIYQLFLLDKTPAKKIRTQLFNFLLDQNLIYNFELPVPKEGNYIIYNFNILRSGEYYIRLNSLPTARKWFKNGKEIGIFTDKSLSDGFKVYLTQGTHEFAVNVMEDDYLTDEISLGNIGLTDKSNYSFKMNIPDTPTQFQIDFDYLFRKGSGFKLQLVQNIEESKDPTVGWEIRKDPEFHEWQHKTLEFNSTIGSEYGYLETVPRVFKTCSTSFLVIKSCWDKVDEYEVEFRNLRVRQIHYPRLSLSSNATRVVQPLTTSWQWLKVNPSLYVLKIDKKTSGEEAIVFSELYNSNWKLYQIKNSNIWDKAVLINNWQDLSKEFKVNEDNQIFFQALGKKSVLDDKHYLANLYANSWIIEKPGNYEFLIMFEPEQNYYIGKIVSIVSISLVIVFFLVKLLLWRKRIN